MNQKGKIVSVNLSAETGTPKTPVARIVIGTLGVMGDAHRGTRQREVSLLASERIGEFAIDAGFPIGHGDLAENITTQGIPLKDLLLFDMLKIGKVLLEVTQIGKDCHGTTCAIFRSIGKCLMPDEGIFTTVRRGGVIKPGDTIERIRRLLKIRVITLSDRASKGVYEDASGPAIRESFAPFLESIGWASEFTGCIIPDEKRILKREMRRALHMGSDIIFTTGGTGLAKRDITPDVIRSMLHREIPGIMEWIRAKHAKDFPNSVLSRSIAGVTGSTLVYVLPGNPRAVRDYMEEINKTIEHCILMAVVDSKSNSRHD